MPHKRKVRIGGAMPNAFRGKLEEFHVATLIEITAGAYPESTLNPSLHLSPCLFKDIWDNNVFKFPLIYKNNTKKYKNIMYVLLLFNYFVNTCRNINNLHKYFKNIYIFLFS